MQIYIQFFYRKDLKLRKHERTKTKKIKEFKNILIVKLSKISSKSS